MMFKKIVVSTFFAVVLAGCSVRQVYQTSGIANTTSANAIDINTATVTELENLPHVGPKTAAAIVQFRNDNGPFRRTEYLMRIRGISEKHFAELRPFIKAE
jgi:competence protein ComEA